MKILALETTERVGSVAAMSDGNLLLELNLDPAQRSAQSLAPAMKTLLERVGWRPPNVDLVATTLGPGSFTGLRLGVTTAKAFAYCAKADVLGVDTLHVIALQAPPPVHTLSVALDAQRGHVMAATFQRGQDAWFRPAAAARLVPLDTWLEGLPAGAFVSGPILHKVAGRLPDHATALDPKCWHPSAAAVARLAANLYAAGLRHDVWTLVPRYSRPSAAQEKWENKGL